MSEPALPLELPHRGITGDARPLHVVSWGLGVESSAYLVEVLSDPDRHGIDPSTMIVLHAVVGSEWAQTYTDAEQFLLPLLADRGVRTVQLARGGPRESDGIVVLDDTTRPQRLHRRGPWTLAEESTLSGTVPQLSHRRCSLKFKAWPLDTWISANLGDRPYEHVIGYSVEEMTRAKRDLVYATATRSPSHPLIRWGWTRDACSARLLAEFGVIFQKSACVFCPYAGGRSLNSTLSRMRESPDEAATALLLEAPAIALNPRSKLFGTHSLLERLIADGNTLAVDLFHARLAQQPWSVYEVRRLHFASRDKDSGLPDPARKGTSWRSVRTLYTGTENNARAWLAGRGYADDDGRLWLRQDLPDVYPRAEHFLVATTAGIAPKARPSFEQQWQRICGDDVLMDV
ncbi:hypothetical protein DL991_41160 [Amycolatopsis sp. WAC 01375]|uniref:hypothetical protein n=1 Tax=Amycolatopsis sp. WAC 01375 TaxID=2203194 RepID=UPI000F7B1628|nr:hypothetical protein [Amycolatopsis sp. WAC 01375]RSM68681.1 hypothetical protein DL991_41160 [Amycolatopsis sp. WAC 01375]